MNTVFGMSLVTALLAPTSPAQDVARELVQQWLIRLEDDKSWQAAADELAHLRGKVLLPILVDKYKSERSVRQRQRICEVFRRMGEGAEPVLSILVAMIVDRDREPHERSLALNLLGEIGPWHATIDRHLQGINAEQIVNDLRVPGQFGLVRLNSRLTVDPQAKTEHLIEVLEWGDAYQVRFAAQILALRGSVAKAAIPALSDALKVAPPSKSVNGMMIMVSSATIALADAILAIDPDDRDAAVLAHLSRISGRNYVMTEPHLRIAAAQALGRYRAAEAVPALIQRAQDGTDVPLLLAAIKALGMIGPEAKDAIPVLEDWLKQGPRLSGPEQLVDVARSALEKIRQTQK